MVLKNWKQWQLVSLSCTHHTWRIWGCPLVFSVCGWNPGRLIYEISWFSVEQEVSLSCMEQVGKQNRELSFMQSIIGSQWQSVLELTCLQLCLTWPEAHWNHLSFVKSQIFWYLIFLSVGKIVTLGKHQLIETLCGIVTISARFCRGEFHISRFKCLTKPEKSHGVARNQKPDFSAGTGDMGWSPMGKTSFWIKLSRGWKTEG